MKVLGIIPARYASSRFPGKPLIDLGGKSMIQRVYEGAKKSELITEVIVATDDQRIYDEVKSIGGMVVMTSAEHSSGTDRCAEVAEQFSNYDVVINIQGDEPLIDFRQLNQLIACFKDPETEIATLANPNVTQEDLSNPNRIKLVLDKKDFALYFSRSSIPNSYHFKGNALQFYPYLRHIGVYAFKRDVLLEVATMEKCQLEQIESLEQLRWMYHGYKIKVANTEIETPNIDVPEDVSKVLALL